MGKILKKEEGVMDFKTQASMGAALLKQYGIRDFSNNVHQKKCRYRQCSIFVKVL